MHQVSFGSHPFQQVGPNTLARGALFESTNFRLKTLTRDAARDGRRNVFLVSASYHHRERGASDTEEVFGGARRPSPLAFQRQRACRQGRADTVAREH